MNDLDDFFTQRKYAEVLSSRLDKYVLKRSYPFQAAFRCDICGDSQKSKYKKRGSIIEREMNLFYGCFNCGASHIFPHYLKLYHPDLYSRYRFDLKTDNIPEYRPEDMIQEKKEIKKNPLSDLVPARDNTFSYRYLKSRKIPDDKIDLFYFVPKFYEYINSIIPDKFSEYALEHDHERLIIPLIDIMGTCFGVQGRSFEEKAENRYLTVLFDEDREPIFGLDKVDWNKKVYAFEGPIDSVFIENSIAITGSDNSSVDKNAVIVLDNQPRNKQVIKKYNKYINMKYQICIWPQSVNQKDINNMILAGMTANEIKSIIDKNTYKGVMAQLMLSKWRKV